MTYEQLRDRCIRFWGMHPETQGTIGELWAYLNSHGPTMRRNVAEPSAAMLFGTLVDFIDERHDAAERDSSKEKP